MTKITIAYRGQEYPARIIKDREGNLLTIAGLKLLDAIHPGEYGQENDGFADKEAVAIDEKVFFFTDDQDLSLSDKALTKKMKEANPEIF